MASTRAIRAIFSLPLSRTLAGVLVALTFITPRTGAQTKDVETRYVTVNTDNASLRCGGGEVWYVVGQVKAGDVLAVDGESYGWLRVHYPPGLPALVAGSEAEPISGRSAVRLTQPSKLFAFCPSAAAQNPAAAVRDSWKSLLRDALPAGTELRLVQTLSDAAGKAAGYLVEAPPTARAYLIDQSVRAATDAEQQAASTRRAAAPLAANPPARSIEPSATKPAVPQPSGAAAPQTTASGGPAHSIPPDSATSAAAPTFPTDPAAQPPTADAAPATTTAPVARAPVDDPVLRRIASFAELDKAYKAVIAEPIGQAELSPLVAEFKRLHDSLGDSREDQALRPAVKARMDLLQIRADLQQDLQKLASVEAKAQGTGEEITRIVATYNAGRPYTAVGRLMASTIYDGERLPLMYRLQSVEGGEAVRTLAYVVPADGVDLTGKLGSIVGVEGDGRQDPALRLEIILPRRVDALTSAEDQSQ